MDRYFGELNRCDCVSRCRGLALPVEGGVFSMAAGTRFGVEAVICCFGGVFRLSVESGVNMRKIRIPHVRYE